MVNIHVDVFSVLSWGQINVKETGDGTAFPLVASHKVVIYYDAGDYNVVGKTACLLAEDIKRVTNKKIAVSSKKFLPNMLLLWGQWDITLLLINWWQRDNWMSLLLVEAGNSLLLKQLKFLSKE